MKRCLLFIPFIATFCLLSVTAMYARETDDANNDVLTHVMSCLQALDNLEAQRFAEHFAEDATMFFPYVHDEWRVEGREAIRIAVQEKFDATRPHLSGPPYLHLEPLQMEVRLLEPEVAVVTWLVDRGTHIGRRTAVLRKTVDAWQIVSWHASNLDKQH